MPPAALRDPEKLLKKVSLDSSKLLYYGFAAEITFVILGFFLHCPPNRECRGA